MEWISVHDRVPPQGKNIKIKAQYNNEIKEAEAILTIGDIDEEHEYWQWTLSEENFQKFGTWSPTHWMPLQDGH